MPCSICKQEGHNKISCPARSTAVALQLPSVSGGAGGPPTESLDTIFHSILAEERNLTDGDHLIFCNVLKKAFDASKAEKIGRKIAWEKREDSEFVIELPESNIRIDRVHETQICYHGPSPNVWNTELRITEDGKEPYTKSYGQSFYSACVSIIQLIRPKKVIFHRLGFTRTLEYERWITEKVEQDLVEFRSMKKYLEGGGHDKDDESTVWNGEYHYARFLNQGIMNFIQNI